jgi:hypothetical protein
MSACEHASSSIFLILISVVGSHGVGHINRPYALRRVITQLHDITLLVLRDPHYLPWHVFFVARYSPNICMRGDTSRGDASGITISAAQETFPFVIDLDFKNAPKSLATMSAPQPYRMHMLVSLRCERRRSRVQRVPAPTLFGEDPRRSDMFVGAVPLKSTRAPRAEHRAFPHMTRRPTLRILR